MPEVEVGSSRAGTIKLAFMNRSGTSDLQARRTPGLKRI
jgi:hypothetical protein